MFDNAKNSKKQGEIGITEAIAYFTRIGYSVAVPITDSNDYDLVIEKDNQFYSVQVKTSSRKIKLTNGFKYTVNLSVKGGNRSFNTVKYFDKNKIDFLFIVLCNGDMYCIPTKDLDDIKSEISIGTKYIRYRCYS